MASTNFTVEETDTPDDDGEETNPDDDGEEINPDDDSEEISPDDESEEINPDDESEEINPDDEGEEINPDDEMGKDDVPNTGDTTNPFWLILLLVSGAGILLTGKSKCDLKIKD